MRMQDYRNVVDRIHHDPDCKQEVLAMANRANIEKKHGFGLHAGAVVAAALLLVNAGVAYKVFAGNKKPETSSVATDALSVNEAPLYVQRLQEVYAWSGYPCNFDCTGMGREMEMTWESDEWKVDLRAMAGCDTMLYFFYDVTPKQGQTPDDLRKRWPAVHISLDENTGRAPRDLAHFSLMGPADEGAEVYHGYGYCVPADGFGMAGQNVTISCVNVNVGEDGLLSSTKEDIIGTKDVPFKLDFIPELPVENLKEAFAYSVNEGETAHATGVKVSPFGLYFSDAFFDDIDRASVVYSGGPNIRSIAVKAVMNDGKECDIPLQNNTACNDFMYIDENGEEQMFKNALVVFGTPVALENVQCFVVSCDGVEGTCTIPVNPDAQTTETDTEPEKQTAEEQAANDEKLLYLDMSDEAYAALSEAQKTVYDEVRNYWTADNTFAQFSGIEDYCPQYQIILEDGGRFRCGDFLDVNYWVNVEQFTELQHPCNARIRMMYDGQALPIMIAGGGQELEDEGLFECGEGTGFPLTFNLTDVPDGAAVTLEVYYSPMIEIDGNANDITVLKTIDLTYDKLNVKDMAALALPDLFKALNCVLTDMECENLDLTLAEGYHELTADERISAEMIEQPQTKEEMDTYIANRLTDVYYWDTMGEFDTIRFTVSPEHLCDKVTIQLADGTVFSADAEQIMQAVQQNPDPREMN